VCLHVTSYYICISVFPRTEFNNESSKHILFGINLIKFNSLLLLFFFWYIADVMILNFLNFYHYLRVNNNFPILYGLCWHQVPLSNFIRINKLFEKIFFYLTICFSYSIFNRIVLYSFFLIHISITFLWFLYAHCDSLLMWHVHVNVWFKNLIMYDSYKFRNRYGYITSILRYRYLLHIK